MKDKKLDNWPCPGWKGGETRKRSRQKDQGVHRRVNEKAWYIGEQKAHVCMRGSVFSGMCVRGMGWGGGNKTGQTGKNHVVVSLSLF